MPTVSSEQLLAEVEDLLRTMPPRNSLGHDDSDTLAWLGRATAVAHSWNPIRAIAVFDGHVSNLGESSTRLYDPATRGVITSLHQMRHDLRLQTIGPLTVSLPSGGVFDYFDEVRKVIAEARSDLYFVDPYLDAEFVSRYLPHVASGTSIRLLGRERISTLLPAVDLMRIQSGYQIEVRSSNSFHDRFVFVDRVSCYQSGASFKDGAKKAPTTLTQILDAFAAMSSTYETIWSAATSRS